MYYKSFFISLFLFILILGCSENDKIVNVNPPPGVPDSEFRVLGVSHDSIRVGEKLVARINNLVGAELHYVQINDIHLQHRSISDTTISIFIPHHALSGQLKFKYSGSKDTTIYSDNIIITDSCASSLCVDWNSSEGITEFDSRVVTWDDTLNWSCQFSGDTVLRRRV